jgi:hypothetical protein
VRNTGSISQDLTPLSLFNKAPFAIDTLVLFENYIFIHYKSGVGLAKTKKHSDFSSRSIGARDE